MRPARFWKFCLSVSAPTTTFFLFVYMFADDVRRPYGGYPPAYQAVGWTIFGSLLALMPLTFWRRERGALPPVAAIEGGGAAAAGASGGAQTPLPPSHAQEGRAGAGASSCGPGLEGGKAAGGGGARPMVKEHELVAMGVV